MTVSFHQAKRKKAKLRLALAGPAGAGKTYSALLIAFGLDGRVVLLDTERGSGELYSHLGKYDVHTLEAPFTPEKYTEAIKAAEAAGYDTIIVDSLSHAWAGSGGVLDIHAYAADKSGNSYTAWREVTPRHNELVNSLLQSKCDIIATLRSKMEYIQTSENGKNVIKKVGLNPIQRNGVEYEFTVFLDLDQSHLAYPSKDRTSLFDGQLFKPTQELGQTLKKWLEEGAEEESADDRKVKSGGKSVLETNTRVQKKSSAALVTPSATSSTILSKIPANQSHPNQQPKADRQPAETSKDEPENSKDHSKSNPAQRLELPAWMIDRTAGPARMAAGRSSSRHRVF